MAEKLVTTIEHRRSGARLIKFTGVLDEENRLSELSGEKVGTGTALLNLSGIERINSSGVRDWMLWIDSLRAQGTRPVLVACSPVVVDQLNRIKNFAGSAIVKSFHVPYLCPSCDAEKRLLVHVVDMAGPPYSPPACACDACGAHMNLAADGESYFAFLVEQRRSAPELQMTETPVPELARGSRNAVTPDHVMHIAKPRNAARASAPSLSAFQLPDVRYSEREITRPRPMEPPDQRPYMIAILFLLLCAVGVLAFLLLF